MTESSRSPREEAFWLSLFSAVCVAVGGWAVYGGYLLWPSHSPVAKRAPANPNVRALGPKQDDPLQLDERIEFDRQNRQMELPPRHRDYLDGLA